MVSVFSNNYIHIPTQPILVSPSWRGDWPIMDRNSSLLPFCEIFIHIVLFIGGPLALEPNSHGLISGNNLPSIDHGYMR